MTIDQISEKQARDNLRYETAKNIRKLLDEAREQYGDGWEDDAVENDIISIATEEA